MLRVSEMTVYRRVARGDIPAGKIGNSIRPRKTDVENHRDTGGCGNKKPGQRSDVQRKGGE
jgi:excisionase family DNA binding protein